MSGTVLKHSSSPTITYLHDSIKDIDEEGSKTEPSSLATISIEFRDLH